MAEKYKLLQITNRIQLIDLINAIQPISETYFIIYTKQANNTKKAYLLKYRKVIIELWEVFATLLKVIPSLTTRGSVFNIDFIEESKEDISITNKVQKGKGNSLSCS